jgi:hypothetical protein
MQSKRVVAVMHYACIAVHISCAYNCVVAKHDARIGLLMHVTQRSIKHFSL